MANIASKPAWRSGIPFVGGIAAGAFLGWQFTAPGSYLVGVPFGVLGAVTVILLSSLVLDFLFGRDAEPPAPDTGPGRAGSVTPGSDFP